MPEHTSFFSYLIAMFPALGHNMHNFGETFLGHKKVDAHGAEPLVASAFVVLVVLLLALRAKMAVADYEKSVIPDEKLSLRLTSSLGYLVIYTPPQTDFFCVEPVSHVFNAIHMAEPMAHGLVALAPGQRMAASMRLGVAPA